MGCYGLLAARADLGLCGDRRVATPRFTPCPSPYRAVFICSGQLRSCPHHLQYLHRTPDKSSLTRFAHQPAHSPTRLRTRADAPSNFHCPGDTWADLILMRVGCRWPVLISGLSAFRGHLHTFRGSLYPTCFFSPVSPGIHQQGYWLRSPPSVDSCASSCSTAVRYWQPIGFLVKVVGVESLCEEEGR